MKLVLFAAMIFLCANSSYACGIKELSSNNYAACLESVEIKDEIEALRFCQCLEKYMDWKLMLKKKAYIDLKKCEFTELKKLITEKETLAKCPEK
jgi:hypothetical protein